MKIQTTIGPTVQISGNIATAEDLIIEGAVTGNQIDVGNNSFVVGLNAIVKSNVKAHTIIVTGELHGNCIASKIVIAKTGKLVGDMTTDTIDIEDKGYYKGVITLRNPPVLHA